MTTAATDAGAVADDGGRRPDPVVPERTRRRTFTAAYKQEILAAYKGAPDGEKARSCAVRACTPAWSLSGGVPVMSGAGRAEAARGCPAADPRDAQIARLTREKAKLEQELAASRFVVEVQAKLGALLEKLSESANSEPGPTP